MTWSWDEIDNDWLEGAAIATAPDDAVAAFERAERFFGRSWIEAGRTQQTAAGPVLIRGSSPTLNVIVLGEHLVVLEAAVGCRSVVDKLKARDSSAYAELTAMWLTHTDGTDLECEPEVAVGARRRKPDFRLKDPEGLYTYVEVTQPNRAAAQRSLLITMQEVGALTQTMTGTYAAEFFLLRHPEPDELVILRELLEQAVEDSQPKEVPLADELGVLYVHANPAVAVIEDHGYPTVPRLGQASVAVENGQTVRQIVVRVPFYDHRAHQFLATEASQLPIDAPGLIVMHMSGVPSGMKEWIPLLRAEFELGLYNHVSAVCLFHGGLYPSPSGETWQAKTKLVMNDAAVHSLPAPLENRLRGFDSQEDSSPDA